MRCVLALVISAGCGAASTPVPAPIASSSPVVVLDRVPNDALELDVRVIRWDCVVAAPDGTDDSDLRVPTGRAVRLVLHDDDSSADLDVEVGEARVHLPRGTRVPIAIRIDRPGSYAWRCPVQQPPGGQHIGPPSSVIATTPTAYEAYQALRTSGQHPTTLDDKIKLGKALVDRKGCTACHSVDGSARVGISLAGLWGTRATLFDGDSRVVDAAFIADALMKPQQIRRDGYPPSMPSYDGQLRAEEVEALTLYIESLR